MDRVGREIEKERLPPAPIDKRAGFFAESVGQMARFLDLLLSAEHRVVAFRQPIFFEDARVLHPGDHIFVGAFQKAEILVKAVVLREISLHVSQVPLPDGGGAVALRLEVLRQGLFGLRKPKYRPVFASLRGIELVAEALLITAGEQRGPRWTTHRAGHIAVGEPRAGRGNRVDVGRGDFFTAEAAEVPNSPYRPPG